VIQFFGDQPFWGRRISELGVGPDPLRQKKLGSGPLGQAIQKVMTDQGMRQRAAELGKRIQAGDGIARAVAIIQRSEERVGF
jgi:sterol 3beta-glucosyltransferase